MTSKPLTLRDLERLLDVHGTAHERWPEGAVDGVARLLAESPAARALWEESVALDRALGSLPPLVPTRALVERVLAAAPSSTGPVVVPARRPVRWRRAAAAVVPLAAAAGLAVWIARGPAVAPAPSASALTTLAVGEYESPTDYLLDSYGVDASDDAPSVGCTDSTLGCPSLDDDTAPRSPA
jgi:hypothetical protein